MKEWVPIATFSITIIGVVSGLVWRVSKSLSNASEDASEKRGQIYEKMNENKRDLEEKFVHKDVCEVLHKSLRDDIKEIKMDVKTLLKNNRH